MINYQELWNNMVITDKNSVISAAKLILKGKDIYDETVSGTRVPWYFLGVTHYRESSCKFNRHPHNGDPLSGRTVHVPVGRPIKDPVAGPGKSYIWIESAKDAYFTLKKLDTYHDWDINSILYRLEAFNGFGYESKGIYSPYLWSKTAFYKAGKFIADGKFDPNFIDQQVGVVPIVRYLTDKTLGLV